jgi:hypothetical protein
MTLTIFGFFFVMGAALGLRFKVLILLPAIGLAAVGIAGVGIAHGDGVGTVMLTVAIVATALQMGYFFGLVMRPIIASFGVHAAVVEKLRLR